jgi:hypothetical protein
MISNVFADTEFDVGEERAYVIGGGLGLLFYRDGESYYINARMHDLEHFFARRTGARVEFESHTDIDTMLARAKYWALDGQLPFLYCEARELSLFRGVLPWDEVHPYGEHALPVRSITANGDALCNDYLWERAITVPQADLLRSVSMPSDGVLDRACPARTFAVGRLVPPERVPNLSWVLAESISENSELYLNPANNTQGERALKTLERDLASMPDLLDDERMREELKSMSTMLEKIGTGGGAGRHLYARGLRVAADDLKSASVAALAVVFGRLGGQWRRFAHAMRRHATAPTPREDWQSLVTRVREIRRDEVNAVKQLRETSHAIIGALS